MTGALAVKTSTINICNSSQLLRLHRQDLTSYISRTRTSERSSKTRTTWRPSCCTSRATPRSTTWWVLSRSLGLDCGDVNQPSIILIDWCKQSDQKLSVIVLVFNPSQIWSWNCPQLQASRVWELLSVCLSVFVEKLELFIVVTLLTLWWPSLLTLQSQVETSQYRGDVREGGGTDRSVLGQITWLEIINT